MTQEALDRDELKRLWLLAFDSVAVEHGAGHQGKLAARYVLHTPTGSAIELMFEKGPKSPANLWLAKETGRALLDQGLRYRFSPATDTYAKADANGRALYGRHSGLKPMRQLAHADLLCFTIERPTEVKWLLDKLLAC